MEKFDVIIVGAGVGLTFVDAASSKGLKCALIEKDKPGGTCLTRGCIPSKVLVAPADMVRKAEHASSFGVGCSIERMDWKKISSRMWEQIDHSKGIEASIKSMENVWLFKGTAEFTDDKSFKITYADGKDPDFITGDTVILTPGARTFVPPIEGLEKTGYMTSETFFGRDFPENPPSSLAIIGAGAIGAEFAHIFSAQNTKVHLIEKMDRILPAEEPEISTFVKRQMEEDGIDVRTGVDITRCERTDEGKKLIHIKNLGNETMIECDQILIATGVRSNSDIMNISATNIKTNERGWIITDDHLRTSVEDVWALGDINGKYQFRHKANYEAEIAVNNIFYPEKPMEKAEYNSVPWAVFTHPQVAHAGMTEQEARKGREGLYIGIKHYSSIAKGFAMGYESGKENDGFVKLIADENLRILGAHIVGEEAAVLIQPYVYMMNSGCTCICDNSRQNEDNGTLMPMLRSMVIHPSLSELTAWVIGEMRWVEY